MSEAEAVAEMATARMQLRRLAWSDLDALIELDADPEVMRFISGGLPNSREVYERELMPRMLAWTDQPYGFFSAWFEAAFVGWFHLRPSVADPSMLELGYRLRRAVWGLGLASEGGRHLVRLAFDRLGQQAVDACTHPENLASMRVMQKCSMSEVSPFVHPRVGIEVRRFMVTREAYERRHW
ncbi:GNAT family N-acetyltransferase [Nannocystaceae bacterium ST9]